MDYNIKHLTNERELDASIAFAKKVFPQYSETYDRDRENWRKWMDAHGDLMIFAESNNEVVGIVFSHIKNVPNATVHIVAVDERFRKYGIGREMMLLTEERAKRHGITRLTLGAAESTEGFYEKLRYDGNLLVQSEKYSIEELLSLNTKYSVVGTRVHDGTINQVYLNLPIADREFQREYERVFPGCSTQMIFGKTI